ncbi:DUF2252 family protein [Pseudoduganella sp. UC29_106]|uniref:DUF2252 family protein n=1 Tax=Pseudoduganella sp. UC29_106 TaxID=3374553 RepID=UPI0037569BFF
MPSCHADAADWIGNFLLDLKFAPGSVLTPYMSTAQPKWRTEADRVVAVRKASAGNFAGVLVSGERWPSVLLLKELLPQQDRLSLNLWDGKLRRLESGMRTKGSIVAWAQLRSGSRQGATCKRLKALKTWARGRSVIFLAAAKNLI